MQKGHMFSSKNCHFLDTLEPGGMSQLLKFSLSHATIFKPVSAKPYQ